MSRLLDSFATQCCGEGEGENEGEGGEVVTRQLRYRAPNRGAPRFRSDSHQSHLETRRSGRAKSVVRVRVGELR